MQTKTSTSPCYTFAKMRSEDGSRPKSLPKDKPSSGKSSGWKHLLRKWLPLGAVMIALVVSFVYGWHHDGSKPQSGNGWADQELYTHSSERLSNGDLPTAHQLHFTVGYPLLGVLGGVIDGDDRFMAVSLVLLLASAVFCFLAVKHLFGDVWAVLFSLTLFYWDGAARTFHFASELFAMPWNNQVLFFAFAFYFWLFVTKLQKPPSFRLAAAAGFISGLAFLTREETILFVAPVMAAYLFFAKADWRKWLLSYLIIGLVFLPQVIIKQAVVGSFATSTHDSSYQDTLTEKYFRLDYFYRNTREVIVDSDHYSDTITNRNALFQEAWWLWLALPGLIFLLWGRYPLGAKLFVIASLGLMIFYLAGFNMSAQKLTFHCLRYMSPGFIALSLGVIVVPRTVWQWLRSAFNRRRGA